MELIYAVIVSIILILAMNIIGQGTMILLKDNSLSKNVYSVIGYFIVIGFTLIIKFVSAFMNLSWHLFFILETIMIITVLGIAIWKIIKTTPRNHTKKNIKGKHTYFYLLLIIVILVSLLYVAWPKYFANHLDDGYYLSIINNEINTARIGSTNLANAPIGDLVINSLDVVRVLESYGIFQSYISAVFGLAGITVARVVFVNIHVYVTLAIFYAIAEKLGKQKYLFFTLFLLYLLPITYLKKLGLEFPDTWRYNYAIWYGSAIVKYAIIPFSLYIMLVYKEAKIKNLILEIVFLGITAVAGVAFSPTVYHMIPLVTFVFLVKNIYLYRKAKYNFIFIGLILLFLVISSSIYNPTFYSHIQMNINQIKAQAPYFTLIGKINILIIFCYVVIQCILKAKKTNLFWLSCLTLSLIFCYFVPYVNGIMLYLGSSFRTEFVYDRSLEFLFWLLMIISITSLISVIPFKAIKKIFTGIIAFSLIATFGIFIVRDTHDEMSFTETLRNPSDTLKLVKDVNMYFDKKDNSHQHVVLTPFVGTVNNHPMHLGIQFRMERAAFVNLGAIPRYESSNYNTDEIVKLRYLTQCGQNFQLGEDSVSIIQKYRIEYILMPDCGGTNHKELLGSVEEVFYTEMGEKFLLIKTKYV